MTLTPLPDEVRAWRGRGRLEPLEGQADVVEALVAGRGIEEVDLVTHDMGDSVSGALLARDLDAGPEGGGLPFRAGLRDDGDTPGEDET